MRKQWMVSGLAAVMALSACSEVKKVSEMHDATVKMSDTTEKMKDTTGEMNTTTTEMNKKMGSLQQRTDELKVVTDELYDTLRQGDSLKLRRDGYEAVLKGATAFKKFSEAGKYFMSFEFQLWNNLGQDVEVEKRDTLAQQAAQEFFTEIEDLAARDNSINVMANPKPNDINSEENRAASFNALAMVLHYTNRKEVRSEKLNKVEPISMYSIMEEALLAPRDKEQKSYIREIQAHEDKAVQLLQARYNMFPLVFIDSITKIANKSLLGKAKDAYLGWDFEIDTLSATQLEYLRNEVLVHSVSAKKLLLKIGKKPVLDKKIGRAHV